MSRVVLLSLVMLFGAVFLIVPESNNAPVFKLFPLNQRAEINVQTYVYFIYEHFRIMALCFIIASEARVFRLSCKTFFWLQVVDFFDYMATYNTVWFELGLLPVSMNLVMPALFGLVVIYELIKRND